MEKHEYQAQLRERLADMQQKVDEMRAQVEEKMQQESPISVGISPQEAFEVLERTVEEAGERVEALANVTDEAWEKRSDELKDDIEAKIEDMEQRVESLIDSLAE